MKIRLLTFIACCLLSAESAGAQHQLLAAEVTSFRITLSYARWGSGAWSTGVEAGFGISQMDETIGPTDKDFEDVMHVGLVRRYAPTDHLSMDLGLRVGIGDLYECPSSDCWPGFYVGTSGAFMLGWRHIKIGPRTSFGVIREHDHPSQAFWTVTPVALQICFPW